ncbi:MAG: GGDEF domain-containing protein [Crocosphaera sp.]|nr:GGDEF domain-containing protein [Crocosphaera sp.]
MTNNMIKILLVDAKKSNYDTVKKCVEENFNTRLKLEWISNFEQFLFINYQQYDIYLCNNELGTIEDFMNHLKLPLANKEFLDCFSKFITFITNNEQIEDSAIFKNQKLGMSINYIFEKNLESSELLDTLQSILDKYLWLKHLSTNLEKIRYLAIGEPPIVEELKFKIQELQKSQNILMKQLRQLTLLSKTDGLTGCFNRHYFDEYLIKAWKWSIKQQKPLSLIMIDIDHLKKYNDHYSCSIGDIALSLVVKVIIATVQNSSNIVARYGGDEFTILLPNTDIEGAKSIANKIAQEIRKLAIPHPISNVSKYLTVSMGISSIIADISLEPNVLYNRADRALFNAKERGRNRIEIMD